MRTTVILVAVLAAVLIATMATSRSDSPSSDDVAQAGGGAEPETILGSPVPTTGSGQRARDPFQPYATGQESDPNSLWHYDQMTAGEKRVIDRGLAEDHSDRNTAFAAAADRTIARARAEAAAQKLGVEVDVGVVP